MSSPQLPTLIRHTPRVAASCFLLLAACSGSGSDNPSTSEGGATATAGGATGSLAGGTGRAGSAATTTGGAGTAGGANSAAGASTAGGANTSGGASSTGGASANGGANTAGAGAAGASVGAGGSAGAVGSAGSSGSVGTAGSAGSGGTSSDPCGPSNPAVVPLPTFGTGTFDVTTYGAVGDAKTDDTKMLQAALTAATSAGGGTVTVPKGTFLSGPLTLGSGTNLQLASGAVLMMLPRSSYPSVTPLLTANNAHDIGITGSGTIDGQGQAWWDAFAADSTVTRPQEVVFSNSTRVLISGVRFQNPPEEHIWVKGDTNLTITGITISTLAVSGKSPPKNTDGVDMTATGAFFCNNNIAAGDDNVALSGTNIYLAYSTFGVGHGLSIGSITTKGTSNLTVDHITFNGTTSGVRLKSGRDRGGLVQNLTYTNLTMTNVQNPVYITSYYPDVPTDPTVDTAQAVTATTPYWKNITIKNLTATGSTNGGIIWGLPEAKVSALTFDNVEISAKTGMKIFHATGVSFINGSKITPTSGAAVTIYDAAVTGVTTTNF
jgi:polygalacturonase